MAKRVGCLESTGEGGRGSAPQELSVSRAYNSNWLTVGGRWATVWNGAIAVHKSPLLTQSPGNTITELLLKYQHQDWMLKEKHQNYQDWNCIVPEPGNFFFLFLSACLAHSFLDHHSPYWFLWFSFFFFLSFFLFFFFSLFLLGCISFNIVS
jgi:hypothetical protein